MENYFDPGVTGIELEAAISLILEHIDRITEVETIELLEAGGRILGEDIYASFDNPPFPKSPLDGYAFHSQAVAGASRDKPIGLRIGSTVYAGDYLDGQIRMGEAVRIMTGAPIPDGCDCVIRQEDVTVQSGIVWVPTGMKAFQNYCFQGEDFHKGDLLVKCGHKINFAHIGILASTGIYNIPVFRHPKVALLVTGDEVVMPGEELSPGKIYGSNLHMLYGRLKELGISIFYAKQIGDNPELVAKEIKKVMKEVDLVISTGGVSVGEKDVFHEILPMLPCKRLFWRVNIKPGTPVMCSIYNGKPMLSLSGNPFAALSTFELLARPILAKLANDSSLRLKKERAVVISGFAKDSGKRRFLRAVYSNGEVWVPETKHHASGILTSAVGCNCLVDIPAGGSSLKLGDHVSVWLL